MAVRLGWRVCRITNKHHIAKLYKMNCTFSRNNYKNTKSKLNVTAPQKLFTWRKIIPRKWDLTCVEVRSHLGGMNPFSYKRFVLTKWNTSFCQDLTRVRRLTWVEWLFSYNSTLVSINLVKLVASAQEQRYSERFSNTIMESLNSQMAAIMK